MKKDYAGIPTWSFSLKHLLDYIITTTLSYYSSTNTWLVPSCGVKTFRPIFIR